MEELDLILQQYVATANNPEYNLDWDVINSKFADEFEKYGWDENVMKSYVKTANNPKYNKNWDVINNKFPEFKTKSTNVSKWGGMVKFTKPSGEVVYGTGEKASYRKPKSVKEAIANIFNIQADINENTPEVIDVIAEEYFKLPSGYTKRAKTTATGLQGATTTTINVPREPTDEEIKNHFEGVDASGKGTGDFSKYEQYKEYQRTKVFNLDWVDEGTKLNAVNYYKSQKSQQYAGNIDDDEIRTAAEDAIQDGQIDMFGPGEEEWVEKFQKAVERDRALIKASKDIAPSKLERLFNMAAPETFVKESLSRNLQTLGKDSEAEKVLNEFINQKFSTLNKEAKVWETDRKTFENVQNKYQGEIDRLKREFEDLGEVNEYSSAKAIAKYNEIVAKTNSIIEKFTKETEGLDIMGRQTELLSKYDKAQKVYERITDSNIAIKAFAFDYSFSERALLYMEKSILGDIGTLALGALGGIIGITEVATRHTATGEFHEDVKKLQNHFNNTYAAHINYNESLDNHMQSTLPLNIPWRDVGLDNIGEVSSQLLGNNVFSILSALTYGGAIRAGINPVTATRALTRTFFTVEAGAKLSQMEIAQKNAEENKKILEAALPSAITQDERLEILEQISAQDKALNVTQVQKAFSTILYGGIAAYAERLGTMGYVRRLNTMIQAASRPSIRNAIKGTGAFAFNSGIEYVEEFVTQVGHNLTDIAILKQNKSLMTGIDAEFNMNVLFSTFAIQAPSTGMNIYNSITNEISSRKDIAEKREIRNEVLEWLAVLEKDNKRPKGKRLLSNDERFNIEQTINRLLKGASVIEARQYANAAQLTRAEVDALFDAQTRKRDKLAEIRDLGASAAGETEDSKYIKRRRKILIGDVNQIDNEIDELLRKPEERNKKTVEEVLGKENAKAETHFYFGKYQAAKQIGKGLGTQVTFKDDIVDEERVEGSGYAKLEKYLNEQLKKGNITLQFKNDVLAGVKEGNYALHIGNTTVLMEDLIIEGIQGASSNLVRSLIAYSPFHELQHINDIATGLVKDGDVIESQKAVVAGIEDHLENLHKRGKINDKDYRFIKDRIASYTKDNGGNVNLKELLTIAGELKDAGVLSQESRDPLLSLKILLNKFIRRNFGDREMFFKLQSTEQVLQYIDSFQRGVRGSRLMLGPEEETEKVNFSKVYQEVEAMYNEEAWADPKKKSDLALQMAYTLIPEVTRRMQNVNLNKFEKEEIAIEFATHDQRGLFGLIKKYDKEVNDSIMGYLNSWQTTNKGRFKLLDLRLIDFYRNHPKYGNIIMAMEEEGVGAQVAKLTDETNLENALEDDTKKPKTDVLKVGKVAAKEQDIIEAVNEKGDFRNVIDNNVGTVGNIIFNIPAEKIADPTKNITTSDKIISPKTGKPVKKGERGILEPSEAKSIQDHFADVNTTKKFIQLLNRTNVTEKDADVNKVGENIDVSRDVYGRAIGLPRRILDYFYRPKFKPNGKPVRSQGKTSQVRIWELKPDFVGLNDEQLTKAAEQFQKDLGITGKQQVNKLPTKADRSKIGQLLKGAAVVVSQQASLSAAQRKLEAAKAEKQKIADITAAQSKIAFNKVVNNVDQMHEGVIETTFEGELDRANKLLVDLIGEGLFKHGDQTEIDNYFEQIETVVLGKMPKNMFGAKPETVYSFLYPSERILPRKGENKIVLRNGKQTTVKDYFNIQRRKLRDKIKAGKVKFGPKFEGKGAEYVYGKTYGQMYGGNHPANSLEYVRAVEKAFYDGTREKYNEIHASMHYQFMARVNESIRSNRKNAKVWGNYFSLVGLNTEHPFRMGAEWNLFSENPIGSDNKGNTNRNKEGFKFYEWEHAMMATRTYLYLLQMSLEQVEGKYFDFDLAYNEVMENFKLIALDNYDDKVKLGGSGRQKTMGEDWRFFTNWWGDRYWDIPVAGIKGKNGYGINPKSLLGKDRKTAAEIYNINIEGKSRPLKTGITETRKLNTAIRIARTPSFSKVVRGMSAWDLDDTLARTKSGVWYTLPNPEGTPQPGRKVIFLAGGAGSGKSNVVKQLDLVSQGFRVVNSDISLEWLKKNSGLPANMNDLTSEQLSMLGKLQWEARQIALGKQMKYQGKGDGVVIDGTGASLSVMNEQVQEFKDKGYDVQMIFVETSLETALERNIARKERTLKESIVTKNHEAVQNNKEAFRELFGNNFAEVKTDNLEIDDPMPSNLVSRVDAFTKGYIKDRLLPGEYADKGAGLAAQGAEFDFREFDQIIEGEQGPLFGKALNRAKKYGLKDQFILTARPHAAKIPIYEFLKSQGLHIPLKNIVTLENSMAEAKALWIAEKVGEGYNDIYFADDALQNVRAVENMMNQFDIKGKVQQAKISFNKVVDEQFNQILEDVTGIDAGKRFSQVKGRKRGATKGRFRLFIPPSHEDFAGLLYNFMGKGKKGDAHRNFFEKALIRPLNRAFREIDLARQSIANDYKSLNKEFPNIKKKLARKTPDGDFTYSDAIRVYLWDKHGYSIPGLSNTDQQTLVDLVMEDSELQVYAETLNVISKRKDYVSPTNGWESGDIRMDLDDATGRVGRKQFFTEFNENAEVIFSEENLNKIEAAYGSSFREALEDILYRIQTGKNRPKGQNKTVNMFMNYLNGSVGVVMFLNMRSAVLQQLSIVNYINFADNNIFAAAKAFANRKQYWADWASIFNSDMLKQRRGGIRTDVNAADLVETLRGSRFTGRILIAKLLKLGFTPTQIGDSMAIATGGATYYRNRINVYLGEVNEVTGKKHTQKEAEAKAWTDFQDITQSTQQSARPDMVSQQQASPIGKLVLNFQNITSQYNRFGKKAFLDIYNRRITPPNKTLLQSNISNMSRIMYYFIAQNLIFYTLQTALFAALFSDDEEDEEFFTRKRERLINGSIDSVLRGSGWQGAVIATLKNMAMKFAAQRGVKYNPDESSVLMEMLNVSPVVGIKAREVSNAEKTLNYNKKVIEEMETFDIDNPLWSAVTNYIEAITNAPVNRLYKKTQNVRQSLNNEHAAWQRVLMFLGWSQYNLGIKNPEIERVKAKLKKKKDKEKKNGTTKRKTEKRKILTP